MATSTFQKILGDLSGNRNVKNIISDFQKLSRELKQKGHQLNTRWSSEKQKTMKEARNQYKKIVTLLGKSQVQLDQEVDKALTKIRRSASEVEKNLQLYRKKAKAQAHRLDQLLKKPAAKTTKKATSKKTAPRRRKARS